MKNTTKRATRRLAASLAIVLAFATSSAWAAKNWTGKGADSNWSTAGNWGGNGSGHVWFTSGNISGTWSRLATISEETEENKTTMWVHVGTEDDPFIFQNNASLKIPDTTHIGSDGDNAGAIFRGGIFNGKYLYLADTNKTAYLCLDGTTLNLSETAYLNNGKLVCNGDSKLTAKVMNAGNVTNGVVTIEKNSGDWTFSGTPAFGSATGSVVRVYYRGGSMKSGYMDVGIANVPADVEFEISGGVITNTTYATVRNGNKMTVKDGGKLVGSRSNNDVALLVGANGTAGELNIIDGGEVSVPNRGVCLCYNASAKATVNISNGGALTARNIWLNSNGSANAATINLDGGIIRATVDYADFIKAYDKLHIYVGMNGGTFDTAGHAVTIAEDLENKSGATGFVRFTGGGTATFTGNATYSGKTCVDVGTLLAVSNSTAKANILSRGLEVTGVPALGTPYTVLVCEDNLTDDDLANVRCGIAANSTIAVGADGKSIVVTVTELKSGYWTGGAADGNLSTPGNWSDGTVPTSGNPIIYSSVATTLTVGGTFHADTITIPDYSAVVTLADSLTLNTLTNANRLAIASTGSLTVTGDLVAMPEAGSKSKVFLYSNEGTVLVGGKALGYCRVAGSAVFQYETVNDNTQPIQADGIAYDCKDDGQLYMRLSAKGNQSGSWVVGADGFSFVNARNASYSTFWAQSAAVTLYSADDWTLANSRKYNTDYGDMYVPDNSGSSLTIDTSDYATPATPRKVTLRGRIVAYNPVTIKGCGTVVVDTTGSSTASSLPEDFRHTCLTNAATLYVTDSATLKINSGKKITGNGTVSLAAGTTLALDASALGAIGDEGFTPCIPSLALPAEGAASIRIDGTRLRSGDYVIATVAPGTAADVDIDLSGTALDGRKASVRVEEGKLVLNIVPTGLTVIIN